MCCMAVLLIAGKMAVLERMLHILYHEKKERIVLISNYTQVYFYSSLDTRTPPAHPEVWVLSLLHL